MTKALPTFDLSQSRTVYQYVNSDAFVTGITGPVGSGKTVGSCIKLLNHASRQPIDRNGYRRSRGVAIRNTYPELKTTTIKTWIDTFVGYQVPPPVYSAPIRHHIVIHPTKFKWIDWKAGLYEGHPGLDFELWFLALDQPRDVAHLKSLEMSFAFINEASEVNVAIIDMLTARVGRYPKSKDMQGEAWAGIFYDTNASDETIWTEKYEAEGAPDHVVEMEDGSMFKADWAFYRQPPAILEVDSLNQISEAGHARAGEEVPQKQILYAASRGWCINREAENLSNLRRGYYHQQIARKDLSWIHRFLQAKRVYIAPGDPWVPEFSQTAMVRKMRMDPDLALYAGMDAGGGTLNPACVWGQVGPLGDWRILAELVIADIGVEKFVAQLAAMHARLFGNKPLEALYVDPAASKRDEVYEVKIIDFLTRAKLPAQLAPSNDPLVRRQALARPMGRGQTLPNGEFAPGFLVDPSCTTLVAALAGKWYRPKVVRAGVEAVGDRPVKNEWSHPGDAASYLLLGAGEDMGRGVGRAGNTLAEQAARTGGTIPITIQFPNL